MATRPVLTLLGIKVFLPANSVFGLVLVAWFAIPTSAEALGASASEAAVLAIALVHAVMLYISVLVHELGHAVTARRFNYPVDGVSLTIIGGHTIISAEYRRPRDQFSVALAGPLGTLAVALVSWGATHIVSGVAQSILVWLAWSSLLIGGVNLLPGIPLDGGAIVDALVWRSTKKRWRGRQVAALSGVLVAIVWAITPWLLALELGRPVETSDILVSGLVGFWMATIAWRVYRYSLAERDGLTQPVNAATEEGAEPGPLESPVVHIRPYVRRALAVDRACTIAQAIEHSRSAGAGAIVVTDGDALIGVVRDAAVAAVPEDRRDKTAIVSVARRVNKEEFLTVDTVMSDLANQMNDLSVHEWVVTTAEGAIYGVLLKADIQGKLNV